MSVVIPKDLRSLAFIELTVVELNDVDVDRLLPHLSELVVRLGVAAPSKTDSGAYHRYLTNLAADARLAGFDDERGRQILDGWLRSSVIRIGGKGRSRTELQMDHVLPLTLASFRAGLPKTRTRHRRAELVAYTVMTEELRRRGEANERRALRELFMAAIGHGVRIGNDGQGPAHYDGSPDIDINALLSLYFLEQFASPVGRVPARRVAGSPVPSATRQFGADLLDCLISYGGRLPAAAFIDRFAALLSLHLFQLPLRIALSIRHLLHQGEPTPDMLSESANPLELYCDFTRSAGSPSDDLARQCVQRDLDVMRGFLSDRITLRTLYEALAMLPNGQSIKEMPFVEALVAMVGRRDDPMMLAGATYRVTEIENATRAAGDNDESVARIRAIRRSGVSPIAQLTAILTDELGTTGIQNQTGWFWSTGGLQKPYGLLAGQRASRRSWRYAPSDDLLSALLLLSFAEPGGGHRSEMPIAELLTDLRRRFGILVDRPPAAYDTADNRAAAAANLDAFKRRLQLLGCFDGLSDDFSAQFIKHPLEASA
ncbi:methylation-associated defense system protein MAD7 [Dactylosporangium salmoneum]|uniref:Uncharacterized protein n=1 Tax=Dactylosporangium salmoneum TaxID=53361 RepID=A0ABN3HBS8_9ACTN